MTTHDDDNQRQAPRARVEGDGEVSGRTMRPAPETSGPMSAAPVARPQSEASGPTRAAPRGGLNVVRASDSTAMSTGSFAAVRPPPRRETSQPPPLDPSALTALAPATLDPAALTPLPPQALDPAALAPLPPQPLSLDPSALTPLPTGTQPAAPTPAAPAPPAHTMSVDMAAALAGLKKAAPRPTTGETKIPTRPTTGETKIPARQATGETRIPTRPTTGETKVPTRQTTGETKIPERQMTGSAIRMVPTIDAISSSTGLSRRVVLASAGALAIVALVVGIDIARGDPIVTNLKLPPDAVSCIALKRRADTLVCEAASPSLMRLPPIERSARLRRTHDLARDARFVRIAFEDKGQVWRTELIPPKSTAPAANTTPTTTTAKPTTATPTTPKPATTPAATPAAPSATAPTTSTATAAPTTGATKP